MQSNYILDVSKRLDIKPNDLVKALSGSNVIVNKSKEGLLTRMISSTGNYLKD